MLAKICLGWLELGNKYLKVLVGLIYKEKCNLLIIESKMLTKSKNTTVSQFSVLSFKYKKIDLNSKIFKVSGKAIKMSSINL